MTQGNRLVFRLHAIQRMFERQITPEDVRHVLATGQVIEEYPEDTPYPSRLVLGWGGRSPIHVVAAFNAEENQTVVVTVYEPDQDQWDESFRGRKV